MTRVIPRNIDRTEHDDYILNVQDYVGEYQEALPLHDNESQLVGWKIQSRYS